MTPARTLVLASLLAALGGAAPVLAQEPLAAGSDGVPVPKKTKHVQPSYPAEALAQGIRGIVILDVVVSATGKVESTSVIRSVPGLDEAAIAAARQWEYEPVKVDGKPVAVRLTVPITFALALPKLARDSGIPELRQGAAPVWPMGAPDGGGSAVAEVTLEPDGRVGAAQVTGGDEPWAGSLLTALKTWRFPPPDEDAVVSFRVTAEFSGGRADQRHVELKASGLRKADLLAAAQPGGGDAPPAAPAPALSAPPPTAAAPAVPPPATAPAPAPALPPPATEAPKRMDATPGSATTAPAPAPQTPDSATTAKPSSPAAPPLPAAPPAGAAEPGSAPAATTPRTVTPPPVAASPVPAPPTPAAPKPAAPTAAAASDAAAPPPVEVITAPPPPVAPENGVSAIRDVTLQPGVPDLTRGRRPVAPPVARMSGTTGTVEVAFSVSAAGTTSVQTVTGPELLRRAAQDAVGSWVFRRARADRAYLVAVFSYAEDKTTAEIRPQPAPALPVGGAEPAATPVPPSSPAAPGPPASPGPPGPSATPPAASAPQP